MGLFFVLYMMSIVFCSFCIFCSCLGHSIEKRGTSSCLACPSLLPPRCPLLDECNICTHSDFKDGNSMLGCLTSWISCPGGEATRVVLELWNGHTISRRSDRLGAFVCQSDGRWMVHGLNYTVNDVKTATCYTAAADSQNSPINLNTKTAVRDPALGIFKVNYAAGDGDSMTWGANSTFTLKTSVPYNRSKFAATQTDGSRYSLYQMHAHWGQKGAPGSEHSLDGRRYVAEFHFVHFNPDYETFDNSIGKENGIAVIGVFAQLGAANPEFDKILNAIKKGDASDVHGATAHLTSGLKFNYNKMMPASTQFLTYTGSLTTGNYNTCVDWTIMKTPITLSEAQMNILYSFLNNNFRQQQPIVGKTKIRKNFA